jgi:hypothetical protein
LIIFGVERFSADTQGKSVGEFGWLNDETPLLDNAVAGQIEMELREQLPTCELPYTNYSLSSTYNVRLIQTNASGDRSCAQAGAGV